MGRRREYAPPGANEKAPAGWNPAGASECGHADSKTGTKHNASLPERQQRALLALMRGPQSRNDIDAVCAVSNGPDVVMKLRRQGLGIDMTMQPGRNRFGRAVRHGVYDLQPGQEAQIERLLRPSLLGQGGSHGN